MGGDQLLDLIDPGSARVKLPWAYRMKGGVMTIRRSFLAVLVSSVLLVPPCSYAEPYADYGGEPTQDDHLGKKQYSPYLDIGYPQRVFWGDTHVHTSFSTDAGMIGNMLGPEEAYRFARGETVVWQSHYRDPKVGKQE
jgi:hypothetical protein